MTLIGEAVGVASGHLRPTRSLASGTMDVTDDTFQTDVLARSTEVPVIVDLWAPWCGPCKTLGPMLERAVAATDGAVELAKVNVDDNPRIAQSFAVQSIPAVFAIRDGDEPSLLQALELEPGHQGATEALARILIDRGEAADALTLLGRIPETPRSRSLAAEARLVESGVNLSASDDAEVDARLTALLERVRDDDGARQEFVDLLETLGPEDPRTNTFRRALATRLY